MSKKFETQLLILIQIIQDHPEGVSLDFILKSLKNSIPKRTIQYRLYRLVQKGIIRKEGTSRTCKYFSISSQPFKDIEPIRASEKILTYRFLQRLEK